MDNVVSSAGSMLMGSLAKTNSVKKPATSPAPRVSSDESDSDEQLLIAVGNHQDRAAFNALFSRCNIRHLGIGQPPHVGAHIYGCRENNTAITT